MPEKTASVRAYVHESHPAVVQRILDCADAVVADWDGETSTSREAVVPPLRACLEASGVWSKFPTILAGAVETAGDSLSAPPVAAPPYVTVTSRGPLLRATISGGRLVVSFPVFSVVRGESNRYARGATRPQDAVRVELK